MTPRPITTGLFSTDTGPRLVASRCGDCARLQFPAETICPYCGGDRCNPTLVGPDGELFLFTTITTPPPGYRGPTPFGFGIVALPEGLRVVTRLTEPATAALRPGLPMRLVIEPLFTDDEGIPVLSYAFAPRTDLA